MLSDTLLQELHTILQQDYDKKLDRQELAETANNLLEYFDLLAKINIEKLKNTYDNKTENNGTI